MPTLQMAPLNLSSTVRMEPISITAKLPANPASTVMQMPGIGFMQPGYIKANPDTHPTFSGKPGPLVAGYLYFRDDMNTYIEFQYFPEELKWAMSRNIDEKPMYGQSSAPNWDISAGNETVEFEVLFNSFFEDRLSPKYASDVGAKPYGEGFYKNCLWSIPSAATDDLYSVWAPENKSLEPVWLLSLAYPALPAEVLIESIERTDSFYEADMKIARRAFWSVKLRRHYEILDPKTTYRKAKPIPRSGGICPPDLSAELKTAQDTIVALQNQIENNSGGEQPTSPPE